MMQKSNVSKIYKYPSDNQKTGIEAILKSPFKVLLTLLLLGTFTLSGCSIYSKELKQQPREEATVATTIKAALIESDAVDGAAIRIRVADNTVTLDGFAGNEAEVSEAENIARKHSAGFEIVNNIESK